MGHQNIGAGRVVDQEIVRINKGIKTGSIKSSPTLNAAFNNVKSLGSALHFLGLLSDAGVHSILDHLYGLIALAKESGVKKIYVHAFTDGRDTGPFTGKNFITQAETEMAKKSKGNRVQVIMECTEHKESGMAGTSRYITTKNRKNTTERLELKKYNPILRKYTVHREIK